MAPDLIRKIISSYGLEAQAIGERQSGYRNHSFRITAQNGSVVNLIVYKREAGIVNRIKNADVVSAFVASRGLPARIPLGPGIIRISNDVITRYASLYNYLPGLTIPWEAYTHDHLVLLGQTMSVMHHHLAAAPRTITQRLPVVETELRELSARLIAYFNEPGVQRAARDQLEITISPTITRRFNAVLAATARLPTRHALHMDFVRSNVLFQTTPSGPAVSGILDFEKTTYGPPIVDVARTLSFLLVDSRYKTARHVRKYFLIAGYNKRGPATLNSIRVTTQSKSFGLLDELVNCFLLYDLYKFMRHNPYESLRDNQHYRRTVALLRSRRLVDQANRFAPTSS